MTQNQNRGSVDWGKEVLHAFGIVGRVLLRLLSYVLNILLTLMLIGLITGVIVGTVLAIYIKNYIDPTLDTSLLMKAGSNTTTRIYYMDYATPEDRQNRNGVPVEVEEDRIYASENSLWATYPQFPKYLYQAFIATEDRRFYSHNGVDWLGTGKAVINYFLGFERIRGASTITQQTIKNLTGEDEVRIQRKIQEILRALNFSKEKSREEILEIYLNIIYLSNNCRGVQAASNYFFGKDVSELTLVECAALATIVQNPSEYDPVRFPENNKKRRNEVILENMRKEGYITEAEYQKAIKTELVLVLDRGNTEEQEVANVFSWYKEAVFSDVQQALMEKYGYDAYTSSMMIYSGGLKIYTLMDPFVQDTLEEVYENDTEYFPYSNDGLQPESAMIVIDPYTGDVLGLVGGRGVKTQNRISNRAVAMTRSPGSSIKPLSVYAPALDAGLINYATVFDDVPVSFNNGYEELEPDENGENKNVDPWPGNTPNVYDGLTTVNYAITTSKNTVAVRALQLLTIERSFDFVKNKLCIDSFIDSMVTSSGLVLTDKLLAPLALGQMNYGLTLEEITAAYCIFQNHGVYNTPHTFLAVYDNEGNVILENTQESSIVISDETASIMRLMLGNVMTLGTGRSVTLRNTVDVAGKTGTAGNDFDRWFLGFTPYYVGGTWFGYDMNQTLSDFKQNPSCLVWDTVMTKLHQPYIEEAQSGGEPLKTFTVAAGVIEREFCLDSGMLYTDTCKLDPRGSRLATGYFTRDNMPEDDCDVHVKVKIDTEVGGIVIHEETYTGDPEKLADTALIRVETRSFPVEVYVVDAQYVYRDLPLTARPGGWWGEPYFQNTIPAKTYVGKSYADSFYNRFCYEHYDFSYWREQDELRTYVKGILAQLLAEHPFEPKFSEETTEEMKAKKKEELLDQYVKTVVETLNARAAEDPPLTEEERDQFVREQLGKLLAQGTG